MDESNEIYAIEIVDPSPSVLVESNHTFGDLLNYRIAPRAFSLRIDLKWNQTNSSLKGF